MAISQVIAGAYTATYNTNAVNPTVQGYELEINFKGEMIAETDIYGESVLDYVYRGADCRIMAEFQIYNANTLAAFYPWGTFGQISTAAAPIGRLATNVASAFVLTAVSNTPAAASPATLTGSKAIIAPNNNGRLLFNSKHRRVPVSLMLLPSEAAGTTSFFSTT